MGSDSVGVDWIVDRLETERIISLRIASGTKFDCFGAGVSDFVDKIGVVVCVRGFDPEIFLL